MDRIGLGYAKNARTWRIAELQVLGAEDAHRSPGLPPRRRGRPSKVEVALRAEMQSHPERPSATLERLLQLVEAAE